MCFVGPQLFVVLDSSFVLYAEAPVLCLSVSHLLPTSLSPTGGDGRFGKMYECHNVETGERMVVKEISIQERDRYRVQKAILDRSDPLKKLDHPNILKFFGVECHEVSRICVVWKGKKCRL